MSGTLTYKERYEQANEYNSNLQFDIEYEVLIRLLCGITQYQQLIYDHTCRNMITDNHLRNIYDIISKYINQYGIRKLNAIDLINSLEGQDIIYVQYLENFHRNFTHSADAENWVIRLHTIYEKRLINECKTRSDFQNAEKEINQYKLQENECQLFDTAMEYLDSYDTKANSIIKTYYNSIDNLIGGLQGGNYMILAGSTGMGKTVMALNLAINMAKNKKKVLLFSLEMTNDELLTRIIARETNLSSETIRNRHLSENDLNKYVAYVGSEKFEQLQQFITIPAKTSFNIAQIEATVRKSKADIVYIDYLGLIKGDVNKSNTYEQISDISRRLKLLAIETNKPLIVLHQLNRDMKSRNDKHPTLSDIRDSGKIEQDADFITFVYRPAYYDARQDKSKLEFMIAKSRHTGGTGRIAQLNFNGQYQKVTDTIKSTREEIKQCKIV